MRSGDEKRSDDLYWSGIERAIAELTSSPLDVGGRDRLARACSEHPEWPVRAAAVRLLAERHLPDPAAAGAIICAIHDPVDRVAFTGIEMAGRHRLRAAALDLVRIVGWPSDFARTGHVRKPVGCGAAFAKRALLDIFGSHDPAELRRLEDAHIAYIAALTRARPRRNADVVPVPAGPFQAGADDGGSSRFQIKDDDNPPRTVDLPAFCIDRCAVTNERYREFLRETEGSTTFDHPDQSPGRDHTPAHWHDRRFNRPDLPVVGVDWYDAWAFARWAGGALPSEEEWEKAARGTDGRRYPWGDVFDPARVNHVERAYGREIMGIADLEEALLVTNAFNHPAEPTLPVDALPGGESPYGALQMSGNVWEMTRTNYFTRQDMDPFFKGRRPVEFMNRREAFHVLRGGAWTSPPVCLTTHHRGKDLLTDRHNEVGFRCVYPVTDG